MEQLFLNKHKDHYQIWAVNFTQTAKWNRLNDMNICIPTNTNYNNYNDDNASNKFMLIEFYYTSDQHYP